MRSLRHALYLWLAGFLAVQVALLLVAAGYERVLVGDERAALFSALDRWRADSSGGAALRGLAAERGVELIELSPVESSKSLVVRADSGTLIAATSRSPLGGAVEWLLGLVHQERPFESLEVLQRDLGPFEQRAEVLAALRGDRGFHRDESASGQTTVFTAAVPGPDGSILYAMRASQRGVRQLVALRRELWKLLVYEALVASLLLVFLSRRLLSPIEALASGSSKLPETSPAVERVLARRDELGTLARTLKARALELESRRAESVALAADAVHELKNPLAAISSSLELVADSPGLDAAKRERLLRNSLEAARALARSADELLKLVRLQATLPSLEREQVDLAALTEGVLEEYRELPATEGWTLRLEAPASGATARLAVSAWRRLLRNLIDNALVQPATRRELVIRLRRDGPSWLCEICDFGPGISASQQPMVFQRFFSQRPPGAAAGTGLGLSIARAIVEAHSGRLELESPSPPYATLFRATLPDDAPR